MEWPTCCYSTVKYERLSILATIALIVANDPYSVVAAEIGANTVDILPFTGRMIRQKRWQIGISRKIGFDDHVLRKTVLGVYAASVGIRVAFVLGSTMSPRRAVNQRRAAEEDELDRRIDQAMNTRLGVELERRLDMFVDRLIERMGALMETRQEVDSKRGRVPNSIYDEDDREVKAVWEAINKRMDSQRKDRREARLKQKIEKYCASNQQMKTRMSDVSIKPITAAEYFESKFLPIIRSRAWANIDFQSSMKDVVKGGPGKIPDVGGPIASNHHFGEVTGTRATLPEGWLPAIRPLTSRVKDGRGRTA
ncbi:hypothetical protein CRG98_042639 [Punica granatum]|uniref:PRP1 splicing factor N-terminal domain-containing protein n=1 Tax=Punica granatum TaxID=22663 RepID=A0A2I0HZ23_PUNGR|nr:hypothetical protein CRG98_042639 [Punica granatum]